MTPPTRPFEGRQLQVAVVGCGTIAQSHLRFLESSPAAKIVALVDLSAVVTEHLASMLGNGVRAYDNIETMLVETRPDVVHILTPPSLHYAMCVASLEAGAHVVCEKPLAATADEAEALLGLADRVGRQIMECQNYRYLAEARWLDAAVADDGVGTIRSIEVDVRVPIAAGGRFADAETPHYVSHLPGGAIRDFLPHMVYLADGLLSTETATVVAADWRLVSGRAALGMDTLNAILALDEASMIFRFSALGSPATFRIAVVGDRGVASVDLFHRRRTLEARRFGGPLAAAFDRLGNAKQSFVDSFQEVRGKALNSGDNGMTEMLADAYRALSQDKPLPITPVDIRRPARVVDLLVEQVARP